MQVVLGGYYGKGNGGDEALLATTLQMLPDDVKALVLSGNPAQTRKMYGVASCDRFNGIQVLQALRQSKALILGGGSIMQDATSLRNPIYYGSLLGIAQGMGLKTIALAQGIGPLKHPLSNAIAKRALSRCTAISVRDGGSAELLSNWNISPLIAPDLVWGLEALPVKGLWDLPAPRVAVNLRSHPQLTPDRLACLTKALIHFQKATQTCILLVPFQASQDLALAQAIAPQLPGPNQIISLEDPRQLKGLFQGVEMAIGMRYHSLIMALAHECLAFAISYDPKVSQLMAQLQVPGWELAELPELPEQISQTWIEHYANGTSLNRPQIQSLIDRTQMHRDLLTATLLTT
ncbi:polysaccharide pyruvyl transferase CsaB [Merismopedia glauca]|uniref:Polysaccharide pyruvyl transferase CsaB n=1 Tax=Merismopedia glauca CCAP 1448/3 TaxID=1296344 RepID=A0A2T1BYL7_9CYAN|nr:polysaccharide pyruvyl transferase CsaB [Merismopedia glauca]PSB01126.1 polysaccharide pyruvyl transferase CsaB [Merismopedia glauca CCAP 1448/3]